MSRAEEVLELTRDKLAYARRFFGEGDMRETIHYIWVVFENCINIAKDLKNNTPVHEHTAKVDLFQLYHDLGVFKRNYAPLFDMLIKLRIRADFGAYSWTPKIPGRDTVKGYLEECEGLFAETEQHVRSSKRT